MPGTPAIDATLARFGFYPLAPRAPRPSPEAIRGMATQAGLRLPEPFVAYSAAYGAGAFGQRVGLALPPGCPLGTEFVVDILYAAGAPEDWDALALRDDTYAGRLPFLAIPIATDPAGNLLVMTPAGQDTIYAWDHEHLDMDPGAVDHLITDLAREGVPVEEHDLDQLILLGEGRFPERVGNPSGHGNLYRVAESYEALFEGLRPLASPS